MPAIRTLIIDFEADQDERHRKNMEEIVQWASTKWVFPVYPRPPGQSLFGTDPRSKFLPTTNIWLSPEGNPVHKTSWTRKPSRTPICCKNCKKAWPLSKIAFEELKKHTEWACTMCLQWHRAAEQHTGRTYVWTVTWMLKPDSAPTTEELIAEKQEEAKRFKEVMLPARTEEDHMELFRCRLVL
ncbi:hypothetical protein QBC34DRAFT_402407 [Podospora aff. communis PSN243]|uniref:Uncharacterized protein n=1 Tax=Podospora aff. communis PSN243 TaxID=3040156 RepID=A0AAV9GW16_9PEZI|nr:hypothetical protein QBC34DRAFT_402407 [Podospora aff. communis PSN243]